MISKADNKELEGAIKTLQKLAIEIDKIFYALNTNNAEERNAIRVVLKELKRLQKENDKLERANKTYINSIQSITPVLLEDYIEKDRIREKIEELKEKKENMYSRIKEPENIVGMSLKEYEELNKLYSEYNEVLIRMESLEELLEGK